MNIYFEIQAEEPERALAFYTAVFGWNFIPIPGLPIPYWTIETGGARGGLYKRPAPLPAQEHGNNAFICSFQVTDFDAVATKILGIGGIVAMPKFAVPKTCWQGYFIDPEGNTFGIFQVDENAA
ncbi:MAG TPA: VOC family protein [Dinghuibacter sp.]|uniref:VOC family protein n=1 Tax=Dinghuibacter sp. TaxID=2024697 RepID=UPI002D17BA27|nr:VOC family protein [Dinghuibacter sp.]HTJ10815.1 VOC family protein [Dinghuibacter sp.]